MGEKDKEEKKEKEEIAEEKIADEEYEEEEAAARIKKLKEELKACKEEKAEYLAGWQRTKADFINARRDEEKSRTEFTKYAAEKILREILPVLDSLEKIASADGEAVRKQFSEILKKEGVSPIEAAGKKFDPIYHEAIEQKETDKENEDNAVLEELQKGYAYYERVLRPAIVRVGVYNKKKQNESKND